MDKILILLDLLKQASNAEDKRAFEFIALNKTNDLISYKQAMFWTKTDLGIKLGDVSGNMSLDKNGAYAQFLKGLIKTKLKTIQNNVELIYHDDLPKAEQIQWQEHIGKHAVLLCFKTSKDGIMGGLWIERETQFNEAEQSILEELVSGYSHSLAMLQLREKSSLLSPWKRLKKHQKIISMLVIILCLLPVRLTMTAPAEIIAKNPFVITVPFDGVIKDVSVKPGDTVRMDQTLFTMDKTELEGRIDVAKQALQSAQQNLSRARRESLRTPEKKTEITRINSEIAERKIEFEHAQKLLAKSEAKSTANGIAIFTDSNEFEGRQLSTGTKIMTIADPEKSELLIKVPVDSMLPINKQSPVNFFLNVAPLNGYEAEIISMGYQASPDTDGILTYKIRAKITQQNNQPPIRIGWKGTAKIKGDWSILAYSILRRPLITLRNLSGL